MKDLLRKILVMGIVALFVEAVGSALFRVNISVDAAGATIYVDDDNVAGPWDGTISHPYQNITSGLEHASYGDTVDVFSGTYMENVVVNKSVTLRGESKPVINGLGGIGIDLTIYDNFVYGVTVDGFDITNCSYGIYLVMQNIAIDVTDLSVTIGDIILNNNTISSNSDGIFVDINSVGNVMYGNSSVAIGDLRVANNVIKSSGKGINVDRFKYIGNDMFNNTAFSAGNIEITGNTVNSSQQGIYLYQIVALGETMYDDSRFTMGSILVNDNTVNSGDYGIAPWDIRLFGYGLYGNSSFTMSNIEFCRNIVNSTKDALGFSQFTGFGSHMYGNSSFSMGSVLVNDNTLYGDIWLTNFGNFGSYLNENSSCTMGNAEFCRNMIYINWVGGITFYGLGHFGYEMYNYSLFKMGDFPVNDNIIQCNSTRGGIDCTQSGGFGMNVYDNAVAIVGSFEFDGNDISSGWAGLSLYSLKAATVGNNAIRNCTYGIYLQDSVDNVIHSNSFYENGYSIYLQSSSNNVILENNITLSSNPGIYLYGSSSNVISGNTVKDSPNEHIELLYSSNNNIISGNTLTNSTADVGIYVYACSLNSFFGNNITANANSGIRVDTSSDSTIYKNNISENLADGVDLWSSSNITVSGNGITANNWWGINPANSNNNTISGNNIKSNNCGINSASSDFNIVSANNITDNVCGIYLESSSNNTFHHNNLINNTEQAIVDEPGYANNWDDGYPSGGNYWSEYTDIDNNSGPDQNITGTPDGIWDHPYIIDANNTDHYPLKFPYETRPPTITILSPENKTYAVNASIPLTFTVDEFATWMGYSLDGQANVTITVNATLPTLLDGWHHVTVYANDTFGNMGSAAVYFTVDTTKPNITNVVQDPPTSILPDTVVKINATVTDATSGVKQVLLNCTFTNNTNTWYAVYSMANPMGDTWNATIPPQLYGTNVTYVIVAEDNAGNAITSQQIYGIKYEYTVVPEFPLPAIFFAFVMATMLMAVAAKKKKG
ncbi:right-handed parallel beta-helix repeat-containing protein [Candidatus Bathyarchaeota archaeon]|nr:right-handed parallel beta-helix repeat-containing protein [Candidatus Bathyarchaeota archaeon]